MPGAPLDIARLTLDELLHALVSGTPIGAEDSTVPFVLQPQSRRALAYYLDHPDLWKAGSKRLSESEVRGLISALASEAPLPTAAAPKMRHEPVVWTATRLEIHQFGGLHAHCTLDGTLPDPIGLDLVPGVNGFRGRNGSGKSSLSNAASWVLTGTVQRSQDEPGAPNPGVRFRVLNNNADGLTDDQRGFSLPCIVPVPTAPELRAAGGSPMIGTAVRVVLQNANGVEKIIERRLTRDARGRVNETITVSGVASADLAAALGVSERALEVCAVMLGRIPHIRFGKANELGAAVSELTGLRPIEHLGDRTPNIMDYLQRTFPKKIAAEQSKTQDRYSAEVEKLCAHVAAHEHVRLLRLPFKLGETLGETTCASVLVEIRGDLTAQRTCIARSLRELVGLDLNILEPRQRRALERQVNAAIGLVAPNTLKSLPSMQVVAALRAITDEDATAAEAVLQQLCDEAEALARRETEAETGARERLMALVGQWHEEQHPGSGPINACPVCWTDLENLPPDALLRRPIRDALEAARRTQDHATMTIDRWCETRAAWILDRIPRSVAAFADSSLPPTPAHLYLKAYTEELVAPEPFRGELVPVAEATRTLWDSAAAALPAYEAPFHPPLAPLVAERASKLVERMRRVREAVAFARWLCAHAEVLRAAVLAVVGQQRQTANDAHPAPSLPMRLMQLRTALEQVAPIDQALDMINRLEQANQEWEDFARIITASLDAADAVAPFIDLKALVGQQIEALINDLNDRTRYWLDLAYQRSTENAPMAHGFEQRDANTLIALAEYDGVVGPAHEVTNSSALRAYLVAFVMALREKVLQTDGGLALVVMDDPQLLFDERNQERLGRTVGLLGAGGVQVLLVSYDRSFVNRVVQTAKARGVPLTDREIIPRSRGQSRVSVRATRDQLQDRWDAWKQAKDNDDRIRDFVTEVRVFLEAELLDLLAYAPVRVADGATLDPLLQAVDRGRRLRFAGFGHQAFQALLDHHALQADAAFRVVINEAHHGRRDQLDTADAAEIDADLASVLDALQTCHAAYEAWLNSQSAAPTAAPQAQLNATVLPLPRPVTAVRGLRAIGMAAAQEEGGVEAGVGATVAPLVALDWDHHRLLGINVDWLGQTCLPGQTVVVDATDSGTAGDLVVVVRGATAFPGRLVECRNLTDLTILTGEWGTLGGSTAARSFFTTDIERYRICGVLFDCRRGEGMGPAFPVDRSGTLDRFHEVVEINGHSALPILRPLDFVLVTPPLYLDSPRALDAYEQHIVAVALEDGHHLVKRLGRPVDDDGLVRTLDNVGYIGETQIARFSENVSPALRRFPLVAEFRDVRGFWFN